jgi:hypothetical protein
MPFVVILLVALTGRMAFGQPVQEGTTDRPEVAVRPLYSRVRSDDRYVMALIRKGYER